MRITFTDKLSKMVAESETNILLNRKIAPACDCLFFCLSSVELENNSPKVFRNWHALTFEKCCTRFYLDWRRRQGWKTETVLTRYCIYWIFPLLVKTFRSQFWIVILYLHLLRLYLQCNDIIKDIRSQSHLVI